MTKIQNYGIIRRRGDIGKFWEVRRNGFQKAGWEITKLAGGERKTNIVSVIG